MDQQSVLTALIEVHRDIQTSLGGNTDISAETCPLADVKGFDSVLIPTALRMAARQLGLEIGEGRNMRNLYVSSDGKRKLSLSEVATRFVTQYGSN